MTAKIDWYREVLELEPSSKVFFPLARLLADEGKRSEAMNLLEKGLERHPEFLEARLFRIELLYQEGRKQECNIEIANLSKIFASYAGFWQAWAACMASEQGQSDTASLIRFLAAHFISGPLQLHEVLNRGLDAMFKDREIAHIQGQNQAHQEPQVSTFEQSNETIGAEESSELPPKEQEPEPVIVDAVDESPEQRDAAEAFMTNAGEMLADLDSELERATPASSAAEVAQGEPAGEAPEEILAEPVPTEAFASMDSQEKSEVAVAGDAAIAEPEMALTEMDEIPAIVVNGTTESLSTPQTPGLAENLSPEMLEPGEIDEVAELAEDTSASSDAEDLMAASDVQEIESSAEDELASGADSVEDSQAEPDLETDMQAIMAESDPDLALGSLGEEPEAEAVLTSMDLEESHAGMEEVEEAEFSGQATGKASFAGEIGPEIAAQLTEPEADFFAAASEQEQPRQEPVTLADAEAAMVDALDLPDMDLPTSEETADSQTEAEVDTAEEPEEPFSLRTRSMAEVLAEQGDIQGALDIYEELANAATSADEVEDINRRVATLRGRLSVANASASFNAAEEASAAQNKEKLISMLEALAQRVEARAQ